ncbi:DNA cytosine methyltransferase [Zavarzinia sp.]|uniref:DNA cytosine methyltransferase n=1 Tax=Zavarzinia sp. TaxID=2027920 RepID=UPI003BB62F33
MERIKFRVFSFFCGIGAGILGFQRGHARVGASEARFRSIGGIDSDPAAIRDFTRLTGTPGTVMDLFSRDQYIAFHGHEPPPDWREATAVDIQRAAGWERPHVVFLSAPCKGFSGLLAESISKTRKYQALNELTLRGARQIVEAWPDDPPDLIVFENVPRIASRGRALLDRIIALWRAHGYAVAETTHDCGRLGGLAQSRKRFLMVARRMDTVPAFLYEPPLRPLRAIGDVLEHLPMPGSGQGGPLHRMPALQWQTWVRLAFVEAGADWRSLNRLRVEDGMLADFGIMPEGPRHAGHLGVRRWEDTSGTVASRCGPTNGAFALADPRIDGHPRSVQHGVRRWGDTSGVVTSKMLVGGGPHAVADPREIRHTYRIVERAEGSGTVDDPRNTTGREGRGKYRVTGMDEPAGTVIAGSTTGQGAFALADPRTGWPDSAHRSKLSVQQWGQPSKTATGSNRVASGALCVADPRPAGLRLDRGHYVSGGHYGVQPWDGTSNAVSGHPKNNNGPWSVADPRPTEDEAAEGEAVEALPAANNNLVAVICALDGTWHRPFTTLELAALQSLVDPEEWLELDGLSDSAWRERIGNAVPPAAAEAIASAMAQCLLLARNGVTFALGSTPIWVRPVLTALSVDQPAMGGL